jgi:ATP-dependent Clp protease, protease subunit
MNASRLADGKSPVQYVSFSAEITPVTTEQMIGAMGTLANHGAEEVHFLFSTPGGSVMHGITIYNFLRALPFKLVIYNMGNVDSIGNVIFLAGTERYACPDATFMFHGVSFEGTARWDEKSLRERLGSIDADHKRVGEIIERHTTLNTGQVVELFQEARTKDAAWARTVGIIQATREPKIPPGVPVHSLVFSR